MVATFEAELKFWIEPQAEESDLWKVDPFDCYSNLRSDILETLEKIEVKTTIHMPGNKKGECIVGFKGKNIIDLADNFILARFVVNLHGFTPVVSSQLKPSTSCACSSPC
jgi:glutamine synthetase